LSWIKTCHSQSRSGSSRFDAKTFQGKTSNENDLSLSVRIEYGAFRAEIGGDLSGDNTDNYVDVESTVAAGVGKLDVYKVHHHCSSHSSNDDWLSTTRPTVGIVSAGDGNTFNHPTPDCLERLHSVGTKTYWTEAGGGATPEAGQDVVAGNVVVNVDLAANSFTVTHGADSDTYAIGRPLAAPNAATASALPKYAWSTRNGSKLYHYTTCQWVQSQHVCYPSIQCLCSSATHKPIGHAAPPKRYCITHMGCKNTPYRNHPHGSPN
jgi:hypothetical protein